jgi:AcrR family transcriptional regulator
VAATTELDRSQRAEAAKAQRREDLLAAARRVFAARGFRGTTIADIAEEAGIALGTIYLYFPSKEEVFAALTQQLGDLITGAMSDSLGVTTLEEVVRLAVSNVFRVCEENRDLVRLVVLNTDPESAAAQQLRRAYELQAVPIVQRLERAIEAGQVRPGDADIMAKLVTGSVSIAVYQALVLSDGSDVEKYRTACTDMVTAYLRPQA